MIWRLQTTPAQKVALSITFMTGAFVIVASLYRIFRLHDTNRTDPLWTYTDVAIWTNIEPAVGIICACLPTLRPMFRETWLGVKIFNSKMRSTKDRIFPEQAIKLDSGRGRAAKSNQTYHTQWLNNDLDIPSTSGVSRRTAVTTLAGAAPDPERDESLLTEINVQHDVHIDRAPRWPDLAFVL
ncbi:hypothetical protein MMC16_007489 [Acarospora aff. strigata]|nr:hypothetical protein [Acarospora aff. strigata]